MELVASVTVTFRATEPITAAGLNVMACSSARTAWMVPLRLTLPPSAPTTPEPLDREPNCVIGSDTTAVTIRSSLSPNRDALPRTSTACEPTTSCGPWPVMIRSAAVPEGVSRLLSEFVDARRTVERYSATAFKLLGSDALKSFELLSLL